ncbi:nucleotidyltransferase domain-containing protein [Candidatus Woesearchaeota archaeon]|nr:nucleotidyltransferase domain-containing protein [Candidatus Woesearchaeota archaeon]
MQPKKTRIIRSIQSKVVPTLKRNGVVRAGIFGSYARGEFTKKSDIDIVIQPPKGIGFGFAGIELELEKKLKKKVDLLTYNSIHPLLKSRILKEEVKIL